MKGPSGGVLILSEWKEKIMSTVDTKRAGTIEASKIAYIRAIKSHELADLPNEALAAIDDLDRLFVLTNGDGQKLAIVEGREAAIATARANALQPMSVH